MHIHVQQGVTDRFLAMYMHQSGHVLNIWIVSFSRQPEKEHKPKLFVSDIFRSGGVFHVKE